MPFVVVPAPGAQPARRIEIGPAGLLLGRGHACDVQLDDPHVSRAHARLSRQGEQVFVQDQGSSAGTAVNGRPAHHPVVLTDGDIITMAGVEVRFEAAPPAPAGAQVSFGIGTQRDGTFHNVAGNQYIMRERESFLRQVAATRTRARWLITAGFLMLVCGFGLFASGLFGFVNDFNDSWQSAVDNPASGPSDLPGSPITGVTMLGWALAAGGVFLMVTGIVLHVVAASRRRTVDRDYPAPHSY
jgi:hypothetical protein